MRRLRSCPRITKEMAAREVGGLCYPGFRLVLDEGHDEGGGWAFDGIKKSAMFQRR